VQVRKLHSAYTRSALRRVTGELRAKDLRKAIDALYKRVDKGLRSDENIQQLIPW
jgi:hypothetical protein